MNDNDQDIREALAANGHYDPRRAEEQRKKIGDVFTGKLKATERVMYLQLLIMTPFFVYAFMAFWVGCDPRSLIGYAVLLLIAYESTILVKLWYWIVNTKLAVSKEIKQLRLETAGGTAAGDENLQPMKGTSKLERILWILAIILVSSATGYFGGTRLTGVSYMSQIRVAADGATEARGFISYICTSSRVLWEIDQYYGTQGQPDVRWLDEEGREMPHTVENDGQNWRFRVRFNKPVQRGDLIRYQSISRSAAGAIREGDRWVLSGDPQFARRYSRNRYDITVELPRGAEVFAADPEPVSQWTMNGVPILRFSGAGRSGGKFNYRIEYTLPEPAA
jgi:hypothetical protein